jgi:hypothetical protein
MVSPRFVELLRRHRPQQGTEGVTVRFIGVDGRVVYESGGAGRLGGPVINLMGCPPELLIDSDGSL